MASTSRSATLTVTIMPAWSERGVDVQGKRPRRAMMSKLRTTSSPRLAVHAAHEAMLQRGMDRVVTSDMDSAMNDEAKIERAQVERAEEMCRARNRKNRARRERKREKARAATIDALFMRDGSQAVGDAVCEETAEEKADEVARRQGALHPEQEAMAHSLSGYAGRSDQDRVMERAKECVAIMKHLYERAQEECARLESGLAQANCERDKATAERDAAAAERDTATAERDDFARRLAEAESVSGALARTSAARHCPADKNRDEEEENGEEEVE